MSFGIDSPQDNFEVELCQEIETLRKALKTTTDAYEAVLKEIGWRTSDDQPPSSHSLIVSNRVLLGEEQ